jgi:hypothetical protein
LALLASCVLLTASVAKADDIPVSTDGESSYPAVAADGAGNFMVVWGRFAAGSDEIYGQRYDSSAVALGTEFLVNTETVAHQRFPAVASDATGNSVVVWESAGDQDGSGTGIFGQLYDSAGAAVGAEFQVNTFTTDAQTGPAVSTDDNGNFVVAWRSGDYGPTPTQDGDEPGIFGRVFDSTGTAIGSEFQVNTYTTGAQVQPAVAMDADGDFIVAWRDTEQSGIFAKRYDSTGNAIGTDFQVNTLAYPSNFPAVAADSDGNFAVGWRIDVDTDTLVMTRRYDSAGNDMGPEVSVGTRLRYDGKTIIGLFNTNPDMSFDSSGTLTIAFRGQFEVFGQRYDSGGVPAGAEFQLSGNHPDGHNPAVASAPDGSVLAVWHTLLGGNKNVFAQFRPQPLPPASCPPAPDPTCIPWVGKVQLQIKEDLVTNKEKLAAKFSKGPPLIDLAFGNPLSVGGTGYGLCIYDDLDALVGQVLVNRAGDPTCSGGSRSCWQILGSNKGWVYKDNERSSDGVRTLRFKVNPPVASSSGLIRSLRVPPTGIPAALLTSISPTVQLRGNDAPVCLSASLTEIKKREMNSFKAKSASF